MLLLWRVERPSCLYRAVSLVRGALRVVRAAAHLCLGGEGHLGGVEAYAGVGHVTAFLARSTLPVASVPVPRRLDGRCWVWS